MDDSRPGNPIPVSGSDLRAAIEAVLADKPVSQEQKPSIGCNIKWKPGKEPAYFTSASGWRGLLQWLVEQLKPRFQFWKSN